MTNEEYDQAIEELMKAPPREWVVCRSREEVKTLVAWMAENDPKDET